MNSLQLIPLTDLPLIQPGDDLARLIFLSAQKTGLTLRDDDIIVIAQKIVSKAEGRFVNLADITPSAQAQELAKVTGKPAKHIEVILWDTADVIRARKDVLIVQHTLGFICANAGVDQSNVSDTDDMLLRLPENPDASARAIRQQLSTLSKMRPPVLIIDSHGRPWRFGVVGATIGLSGLAPVQDLRGAPDLFGDPLTITDFAITDQIASAAALLMGETTEGCPVVIVRGFQFTPDEQAGAADVLRPREMDLFR